MDHFQKNRGQSRRGEGSVDHPGRCSTANFIRKGGRLALYLEDPIPLPTSPIFDLIEQTATETNAVGGRPLWSGYREIANYPRRTETTRRPNQVRVTASTGRFFSWLAGVRKDPCVIEIGTAFGISGMYWLAGIGNGHLYTFDPNADWTQVARENLAQVSSSFTLTVDTFENAAPTLIAPAMGDIAFIDAIHTPEIVHRQLKILVPMMKAGGLILFDDIGFSDAMRACWAEIASSSEFVSAATVGRRTGIVELK